MIAERPGELCWRDAVGQQGRNSPLVPFEVQCPELDEPIERVFAAVREVYAIRQESLTLERRRDEGAV